MKIRDRIKKLVRVRASELIPNPKNWRVHPEEQQNALRGVLAEVGIADAVLARETKDGLQLIDGHLRADMDPTIEWPVLVLDVTEDEADILLATHDPITGMAEVDSEAISSLVGKITVGSEAVAELLSSIDPSTWSGAEQLDRDAIPDYDPQQETYSIRVSRVLASDRDNVRSIVSKGLKDANLDYSIEVF